MRQNQPALLAGSRVVETTSRAASSPRKATAGRVPAVVRNIQEKPSVRVVQLEVTGWGSYLSGIKPLEQAAVS
jgi:hypothetical protein